MNRHPPPGRSNCRGFTFLEVLIAIVGIGIVVTGLGATVAVALRAPTLSRETAQATFIAQEMMDRMVADRRRGLTTPPTACFQPITTLPGGATFTCSVTALASPLSGGNSGCPATAAAGDCQLLTLTVTSPLGGVIRATWISVL